MLKKRWIIGSRKSKLALAQAQWVKDKLIAAYPQEVFEIKTIITTGDKILDAPLSKIGDKGLFTKEIEEALLRGGIDLAVHSLKDLPTELPAGLKIGAVPGREEPYDVLLTAKGLGLGELPAASRVGTSSLRRQAQLLRLRPDLRVLDLRGNLDTRIKKLEQGLYDGIILALAGIKRLGLKLNPVRDAVSNGVKMTKFSLEEMLPQAAQGALGIEISSDAKEVSRLVKVLDDSETYLCVEAERSLLAGLGGGCQVPIGACAQIEGGKLRLLAGVFSLDGKTVIRDEISGPKNEAGKLGTTLAETLLKRGAKNILGEVNNNKGNLHS